MAETDLKLICDSIPCPYSVDLSTQAHNIYYGLTGNDVEFIIQSGSRPSLFPPILTQAGSYVAVSTNSSNGGWSSEVINKLYLDDVEIHPGKVLTSQDNGKILTAISTHPDFDDSSVTTQAVVISPGGSGFHVDGLLKTRSYTPGKKYAWVISGDGVAAINAGYAYQYVYVATDGSTYAYLSGQYASFIHFVDDPTLPCPDLDKIGIRLYKRTGGSATGNTVTFSSSGYRDYVRLVSFDATDVAGVPTSRWLLKSSSSQSAVSASGMILASYPDATNFEYSFTVIEKEGMMINDFSVEVYNDVSLELQYTFDVRSSSFPSQVAPLILFN